MPAFVLLTLHAALGLATATLSILGVQARTWERARTMASLLLGTVLAQTALGDVLYPQYLRTVKPVLMTLSAGSRSVDQIFEVKEHIAFLVLVTTLGAFVVTRDEPKPSLLLRVLFGSAHGGTILVATLGLVVASLRHI